MKVKTKRALLLFFVGMLSIHAVAFWKARQAIHQGYSDFASLYAAGKIVHDGMGSDLYDLGTQWRVQQEFARGVEIRRGPLPYFHPAFEALIFVPLARHSYVTAYLIWNAINVSIIFAVGFLLRSRLPALGVLPLWWQLLFPFALSPVFLTLLQGQDSLVLLLLFTLAYLALKKNADFCAGCWLGLGLFKPQLVLPFVVILLLQTNSLAQKKIRLAAGFLAVAAALVAISAAVVGWVGLLRYPGQIWSLEHAGLVLPRDVPTLRGIVAGLISTWVPDNQTRILIAILSTIVIYLAARKGTTADARSWDLIFCHSLLAAFLVSYHAFAQDLSILVLAFFLNLNGWLEDQSRQGYELMVLTGILLFGLVLPVQQFHLVNLLALLLLAWMWECQRAPGPG